MSHYLFCKKCFEVEDWIVARVKHYIRKWRSKNEYTSGVRQR